MAIREMKLPADLDIMYHILVDSFQYPENPEWSVEADEIEGFKQTLRAMRQIWPLYRLIGFLIPPLRDAMLGYVWEEAGQPAGMVSVARRGLSDSWIIGNVSVLPVYRRRGIARKLVQASVDLIRAKQGKLAVLDVISGNLPAYELYKSLGFEHYTSTLDIVSKSTEVPPRPALPDGVVYEKISLGQWEIPFELSKKLIPEKVQAFDPVEKSRFYIPPLVRVFARLMSKMRGVVEEDFILRDAATREVLALGSYSAQTRSGDRHSINLNIGPGQAQLVPYMLQYMVHKAKTISAEHNIQSMLWEWRYFTLAEHEKLGFKKVKEGHRLGMKL